MNLSTYNELFLSKELEKVVSLYWKKPPQIPTAKLITRRNVGSTEYLGFTIAGVFNNNDVVFIPWGVITSRNLPVKQFLLNNECNVWVMDPRFTTMETNSTMATIGSPHPPASTLPHPPPSDETNSSPTHLTAGEELVLPSTDEIIELPIISGLTHLPANNVDNESDVDQFLNKFIEEIKIDNLINLEKKVKNRKRKNDGKTCSKVRKKKTNNSQDETQSHNV